MLTAPTDPGLGVVEGTDERALVDRARSGESEAFDSLIRMHANRVFGFLVRWLRDRSLAEDVFQEATLRAFRSLHRLRVGAPFRPWFFRIAINRGKTMAAARAKLHRRDGLSVAHTPTVIDSGEAALEVRGLLEAALARLSSSDRQVLVLHFIDGSTTDEIRRMLGAPEFAVKMRLSRARKRFRAVFRELERGEET